MRVANRTGLWLDLFARNVELDSGAALYVLFFVEIGSRHLHIEGVTRDPDAARVTQRSRNLSMDEELSNVRFLVRDRDCKFTASFDEVFRSEGARVIKTPVRAPRANAFAERFVRTAPAEVLDQVLVLRRRHLLRLLQAYETHFNSTGPTAASASLRPTPSGSRRSRFRRTGSSDAGYSEA